MRSKIAGSVEELIGHTPLVRLGRSVRDVAAGTWLRNEKKINGTFSLAGELLVKAEFMNPGGSVKDRIAVHIVNEAEKRGELKSGATIVEATSGNTGAGLALVAAVRGYKCIFVTTDKMSAEKINALRAYGAKVVITTNDVAPDDPRSYYSVARKIAGEVVGGFLANQYYNPDNPAAHYHTTGPEIWEQCDGKVDYFFCAMGTGGTISGTTKFLKEKNPKLKTIGIDPVGSMYYGLVTTKKASPTHSYFTEGIGEDFIPGTVDLSCVDDCVYVNDEESFSSARHLSQHEGLLVGGSCGSAYFGATQYLAWIESKGVKDYRAVVLLPDSGSRYLSKVFNDVWLSERHLKTVWGGKALGGEVEFVHNAKKVAGV